MSEDWLERDRAALAAVLPRASDIVAWQGNGAWLYDTDDNRYLDFTSGIGVTNTGHCHPQIVEAIREQAGRLLHTSVTTHNTLNVRLAERLGDLCPFFEDPQVFFCNSGAEAVDGALKLARRGTGNSGIVAFQDAFHGRTVAATSLTTAKGKYRTGYSPFLPYVYTAHYGKHLSELDELLSVGPPKFPYKIGAIIVEPVLGEGGYVVPPSGWLQELRDRCDGVNRLLIFDEVQTGMGRTGYPFAAETFSVKPDVLLFAKGVASGLPLGGIIAERSTMDRWPEGAHGSTFGGNPVSCAAALATIDVLDDCYEAVQWMGRHTINRLSKSLDFPVSGIGFMIRIEFPTAEFAKTVQKRCLQEGLLLLTCGPEDNIIRLIPPLTITFDELSEGLAILEKVLG